MAYEVVKVLYLCPKHLEPAYEQTPCPTCGRQRVKCRPGEANDPCRKPLISPRGEIRTRAPLWWLRRTVVWLADKDE